MDFLLSKGSDPPIRIYLKYPSMVVGKENVPCLKNFTNVAENHAAFNFYNDSWFVEDLGSEHGVFVNSGRIGSNPRRLNLWDVIGFGAPFIGGGLLCVLCPKFLSNISLQNVFDWDQCLKFYPEDSNSLCTSDSDISGECSYPKGNVSRLCRKGNRFRKRIVKYKQNQRTSPNKKLNTKPCTVSLVKCDSKYFKWPSDVKKCTKIICKETSLPCSSKYLSSYCSVNYQGNNKSRQNKSNLFDNQNRNLTSTEYNWKMNAFFKSFDKYSMVENNPYVDDCHLLTSKGQCPTEIDNDAQSNKSSIKSMNIIIYPSWYFDKHSVVANASFVEHSYLPSSETQCSTKIDNDAQSSTSTVKSMNIVIYPSQSIISKSNASKENNKKKKLMQAVRDEMKKRKHKVLHSDSLKNTQRFKHKQKKSEKSSKNANIYTSKKNVIKNKNDNAHCNDGVKKQTTSRDLNSIKLSNHVDSTESKSLKRKLLLKSIGKEHLKFHSQVKANEIRNVIGSNKAVENSCRRMEKKHSTVKRRPDDYGCRLKCMLSDMQCMKKNKFKNKSHKTIKNVTVCPAVQKQSNPESLASRKIYSADNYVNSLPETTSNNQTNHILRKKLDLVSLANNRKKDIEVCVPTKRTMNKNAKESKSSIRSVNLQYSTNMINKVDHACIKKASVGKKNNAFTSMEKQPGTVDVTSRYICSSAQNLSTNEKVNEENIKVAGSSLVQDATVDIPVKREVNENHNVPNSWIHSMKPSISNNDNINKVKLEIVRKETETTTSKENFYFKFIKTIVELNSKWLQEKEKCKGLPNDISKHAVKLPLWFDSYRSYVSFFFPMIILESWEEICLHSESILKNRMINKFYFCVHSFSYRNCLLKLQCESLINNKFHFIPSVKHLLLLDLKLESGELISSFGFVTKKEKFLTDINELISKWRLPVDWMMNAKLLKFSVYVKSRGSPVLTDILMEGNGVCSLEDGSRQADALSYLKFSPLIKDVLSPRWSCFSVSSNELQPRNDYFELQEWLVNTIYSTIHLSEKKILLIQGPPGSGKTDAIIRMIKHMCSRGQRNKILVTAPSTVAVDELGYQLMDLFEMWNSSEHSPTFVRIGDPQHIHPKLLSHTLTNKLELYRQNFREEYYKWKYELENIQLQKHFQGENCEYRVKNNQLRINENRENELKESIKLWDNSNKIDILKNADVVLCTLNECDDLRNLKDIDFSFCIVDEANQANELEILLPITLGIKKFLLIGDKMQLPPVVKSKLAKHCGFQRSMFERFQLCVISQQYKNPAIILTEQYRMDKEICHFPSNYFYNSHISTPPLIDAKTKDFPLYSYTVLDYKTASDSSFVDDSGTLFIMKLCSQILKISPYTSIGIIVASEKEKQLCVSGVIKHFNNVRIEVETVEMFQGKSKPFVILSCFHNSVHNVSYVTCQKQLNVALTRALQCLIICGPLDQLSSYTHWKNLIWDAKLRNRYKIYQVNTEFEPAFKKHMLKNP